MEQLWQALLLGILFFVWAAWWLWAVNWPRMWAWLGQGAWAPLVLLLITAALVWSQLAPGSWDRLGFLVVPNFWWQLGVVGLLVCVALFCGWLQGLLGWTPAEVNLEPPAHAHGHAPHSEHAHH